ncbi:MAG: biotin--[acetyl-CoA-carboxylase] ligase [Omnitrophica bacterium GWA2_52_12]|nr:MAG: biotin--[acetyl-CoA-carboxylase] ligase [Omnitrophica bacterium GWA2_52_12]
MKFRIEHLHETDSTNTLARSYAAQGAAEGLVIFADFQTEGRGKQGHVWVSPKGKDLLFSLLVRPPVSASKAPMITQMACRAVAAALKNYGIETEFKMPNDVLCQGKKICGTLVEAESSAGKLEMAVIGIGLNVNTDSAEIFPEGISMKMVTGQVHDREKILGEVLEALEQGLAPFYGTDAKAHA